MACAVMCCGARCDVHLVRFAGIKDHEVSPSFFFTQINPQDTGTREAHSTAQRFICANGGNSGGFRRYHNGSMVVRVWYNMYSR